MNTKPIVYICHPIGGDVKENLKKIKEIYKTIALEGKQIPFAPYLQGFEFLDDNYPEDRKIGIENNLAFFEKKSFDMMVVFGETISRGMQMEIDACERYRIPIKYFNIDFKKDKIKLELSKDEISTILRALSYTADSKLDVLQKFGKDLTDEQKETVKKLSLVYSYLADKIYKL